MVEEEGTISAESVTTTEVANVKDISNEHAEETTTLKKTAETPAYFNDIMEQKTPFLLPENKEFIKTMVSFCKSEKSDELTREAVKMEIEYNKIPGNSFRNKTLQDYRKI